jgi:hypothetical protein
VGDTRQLGNDVQALYHPPPVTRLRGFRPENLGKYPGNANAGARPLNVGRRPRHLLILPMITIVYIYASVFQGCPSMTSKGSTAYLQYKVLQGSFIFSVKRIWVGNI